MHVNEAGAKGPVSLLKPQITHDAGGTEVIDTRLTRSVISLVCVHKNLPNGPFSVVASGHVFRAFDQWSARRICVKRPLDLDGRGISDFGCLRRPGILKR